MSRMRMAVVAAAAIDQANASGSNYDAVHGGFGEGLRLWPTR